MILFAAPTGAKWHLQVNVVTHRGVQWRVARCGVRLAVDNLQGTVRTDGGPSCRTCAKGVRS